MRYGNPVDPAQCLSQEGMDELQQVLAGVEEALPVLQGNDPVDQEARMAILQADGPSDQDTFMDEDEQDLPLGYGEESRNAGNPFRPGEDVFVGSFRDWQGNVKPHLMAAPWLLKAMRRTGEPKITAEEMHLPAADFLNENTKLVKSFKRLGVFTPGLMLSPHLASGFRNLCANASAGCAGGCLNISGRGDMGVGSLEALMGVGVHDRFGVPQYRTNMTQEARRRKTILLTFNPAEFKEVLLDAIDMAIRYAVTNDFKLAIRLNTLSDHPWESEVFGGEARSESIMDLYPEVNFYDYTKVGGRMSKFLLRQNGQPSGWPQNYHLTYSFSEINLRAVLGVLRSGGSVAIPFDDSLGYAANQKWHDEPKPVLPPRWFGYPVIDGDTYDYRPADRKLSKIPRGQGFIVGLRIKGEQQVIRHRKKIEQAAGYGGEYGLPPEMFTFFQHAAWWEYTEHDSHLVEAMLRISDLRAKEQKGAGFERGGLVGLGGSPPGAMLGRLSLQELLPHLF